MVSPSGVALAGAGAGVALIAGLGLPAIVGMAAVGWGARLAAAAIPRPSGRTSIDPFALQDPWRTFVFEARRSVRRFEEAKQRLPAGPLRERLAVLGVRVDAALQEIWRVAQSGHALARARSEVDTARLRNEIAALEQPDGPSVEDHSAAGRTVAALQAQLSSAERLDTDIARTREVLTLLDARLREAVTRAIELSALPPDDATLAAVDHDVSVLTHELAALREALADPALGTLGASTAEGLPPGAATGPDLLSGDLLSGDLLSDDLPDAPAANNDGANGDEATDPDDPPGTPGTGAAGPSGAT
ncbi:MAG: hypothetical protein JJU45_07670 [Acidimicrobiia bacterium]|nr:hypothetical protein [Acidimicrobiia bacterium]